MTQTATEPPGLVRVEGVWEGFRIYHSRPKGIKDRLFRFERAIYEDFWALKDVSFEVMPGETLAVIGVNGSGKSTLLKCLSGILPPDLGRVTTSGKLAGLLELGAGFHGDLTGRENIYMNGSILGLGKKEISKSFDEIVDFAGVEEFIDTPVRNYSSGMYLRLGFATAVNVNPDILLIDEILAVGDAAFQTRCFEKMHEFKRRGKTLILITHDLDAAIRLCDNAILLESGAKTAEGATRSVVETYRTRVAEQARILQENLNPAQLRGGTGEAEIVEAVLLDAEGDPTQRLERNALCTFRLSVKIRRPITNPTFGFMLLADDGTELHNNNTMWKDIKTGSYQEGDTVEVSFSQRMPLLPGRYMISTAVGNSATTGWFDWWNECVTFRIVGVSHYRGFIDLSPELEISVKSANPQEPSDPQARLG